MGNFSVVMGYYPQFYWFMYNVYCVLRPISFALQPPPPLPPPPYWWDNTYNWLTWINDTSISDRLKFELSPMFCLMGGGGGIFIPYTWIKVYTFCITVHVLYITARWARNNGREVYSNLKHQWIVIIISIAMFSFIWIITKLNRFFIWLKNIIHCKYICISNTRPNWLLVFLDKPVLPTIAN